MRQHVYAGWDQAGEMTIVYFGETETMDLLGFHAPGFSQTAQPCGWGHRGPDAEQLARVILWHATWDHQVVEDLYPVFHDQITSRLREHWEMSRETVRTWVQHHQAMRDLMHGRDPMRNCPSCGG